MIIIKFILEENRAIAYDNDIEIGECQFIENNDTWNIVHTYVDKNYQGRGIARKLVKCVKDKANEYHKNLVADCSYAKKILFP